MTPKERARFKRDNRILLSILGILIAIFIGLQIYINNHPDPIPTICLEMEKTPHSVKHYTSTGFEYERLEFKCLESVKDPNYN